MFKFFSKNKKAFQKQKHYTKTKLKFMQRQYCKTADCTTRKRLRLFVIANMDYGLFLSPKIKGGLQHYVTYNHAEAELTKTVI